MDRLAFCPVRLNLQSMSQPTSSREDPRPIRIVDGRDLIIPPDFRRALGVEPGDLVIAEMVEGELHIRPLVRDVAQVQAFVRSIVPEGDALVDDLIADRRAEAARE